MLFIQANPFYHYTTGGEKASFTEPASSVFYSTVVPRGSYLLHIYSYVAKYLTTRAIQAMGAGSPHNILNCLKQLRTQ